MNIEENPVVSTSHGSDSVGAVLETNHNVVIVRRLTGTVLGMLVFASALLLADASNLRMPGHIVVFWFPALMVGRALSGYLGSGLVISGAGGGFVNLYHPATDADVFGLVLAALVVEGIMLLTRQKPSAWTGIVMGIAADLGKMLPKLAVILAGSSTPHHNRVTLPYMLASYILFGAIAGCIYVAGRYAQRKAGDRLRSGRSGENSGMALTGLLAVIALAGVLVILHG